MSGLLGAIAMSPSDAIGAFSQSGMNVVPGVDGLPEPAGGAGDVEHLRIARVDFDVGDAAGHVDRADRSPGHPGECRGVGDLGGERVRTTSDATGSGRTGSHHEGSGYGVRGTGSGQRSSGLAGNGQPPATAEATVRSHTVLAHENYGADGQTGPRSGSSADSGAWRFLMPAPPPPFGDSDAPPGSPASSRQRSSRCSFAGSSRATGR